MSLKKKNVDSLYFSFLDNKGDQKLGEKNQT